MIHRTGTPRVHGAWTHSWFRGQGPLAKIFGPAPRLDALVERAERIQAPAGWARWLRGAPEAPDDALIVLAGQQPVLAGGPALVVHKAVTAIALARRLQERLKRPVLPVFLLATQDHDHNEIDHVDLIDAAGRLRRVRCPIHPPSEMFSRAHWNRDGLSAAFDQLAQMFPATRAVLVEQLAELPPEALVADHVQGLIQRVLGPQGLSFVHAHELAKDGAPILERALRDPAAHAEALRAGSAALRAAGLGVAFDPEDPRPLVLESREGRRRRLDAAEEGALERLAASPADFSPHAALRPIVQAACLPVVAQVAGPSEILYLGQARRLHHLHDLQAPLLVPRLEATRLNPAQQARLAPDYALDASEGADAGAELRRAAEEFERQLLRRDPELAPSTERWRRRLARDLERLSARPFWRGRMLGALIEQLRPRGRAQDAVLSWLPDACAADPRAYAEHLLELAAPDQPPVHVFHTPPGVASDG